MIDFEKNVWFWRLILAGGVICATIISGSFLSSQITGWQQYAGWILAGLLALLVYGGVALGVRGYRLGWLIAIPATIFEVIFDFNFLGVEIHGWDVSLAVGLTPAYASMVAGILEAKITGVVVEDVEEKIKEQLEWERIQEEKRRREAYLLERRKIDKGAEVKIATSGPQAATSRPQAIAGSFACKRCGVEFGSLQALGGHSKYCDR